MLKKFNELNVKKMKNRFTRREKFDVFFYF